MKSFIFLMSLIILPRITILCITILCITTACYKSDPISIGGKTRIFQLQNINTFYTDTLNLYGEYLGYVHDSSYVVINETLIILSKNCLSWTQSRIQIVVPLLPKQSNIYVVVNGTKIFYDDENYYQNIFVLPYPPFSYVPIPAGNFDMGSNEFDISNEQPIHNVILTKSIYVSIYEVNQRLYSVVMNENPSSIQYNDYPVYNVSWLDAIKFCNKLSLLDGLDCVYDIIDFTENVYFNTTANGWRLPTEAEWEYFTDLKISNENELLEYAWFSNNSTLNPHSVGLLKPNRFGLYDVLGNVWEWCWDWYKEDYYSISPLINPTGPLTGTERIIRGGSCDDGKLYVRKEYRTSYKDNDKIGFRIIKNEE